MKLKHPKLKKSLLVIFLTISLFISCRCSSQSVTHANNKSEQPQNQTEREAKINVALTFINGYVVNCNKVKQAMDIVKWVNSSKLVTKEFQLALKKIMDEAHKADPILGLDFDPLFNAQDYPDKGFVLDSIDNTGNYLTLKGKDWEQFKIHIKLVNDNQQWLVGGCGIVNMPNGGKVEK